MNKVALLPNTTQVTPTVPMFLREYPQSPLESLCSYQTLICVFVFLGGGFIEKDMNVLFEKRQLYGFLGENPGNVECSLSSPSKLRPS